MGFNISSKRYSIKGGRKERGGNKRLIKWKRVMNRKRVATNILMGEIHVIEIP